MTPVFSKLSKKVSWVWNSVRWSIRDRSRHALALIHRRRFSSVTFVAVSGSAGKTTTKDLGAAVLAKLAPCHKNRLSTNQHDHLDTAVREVTREHKYCILEASAERPGYLDRSLRLIQPKISVLTLIAREHYSAFKSLEAIAEEKGKLVTALPAGGIAVLNIDDPLIRQIGERHSGKIIWVGKAEQATVRLLECKSNWPEPLTLQVVYCEQVFEVRTSLHGTHLTLPVLSAIGIGVAAGLPFDVILAALAEVEPTEGRMQPVSSGDGVVFVRDDWKAPQWSLHAPFQFLRDAKAARKVAVIGSISDSPKSPSQRYNQAAHNALQVADLVVLIGPQVLSAGSGDTPGNKTLKTFATIREAASFLKSELRSGDLVLLKGTNKQDHLVRLVMDRQQSVLCWRTDCGIPRFCNACNYAYARGTNAAEAVLSALPTFASSPRECLVIVGLGNEGPEYEDTPHNVGRRAVEMLAASHGSAWEKHPEGSISTIRMNGLSATLLKPAGTMNACGPLIGRFLARVGRSAGDCIVIHDDMDLPLGQCRVKQASGDGGHKGVRSVIAALGTNAFPRIRIGVRRPTDSRRAGQIVLDPLSREDAHALGAAFAQVEIELKPLLAQKHSEAGVVEPAA
jgi:UDP-N-acetylmuramoyl-tripeptide--D-alanyl-D-alanine ligase